MSRPDDGFRSFVESRAAALHRSAYLLCGVLAQVWSEAGDTMTAVYQPATGSATIPLDPYPAG